jgi:predicted RNA binding protein YcfA (HicA-like mRNA interferase family)
VESRAEARRARFRTSAHGGGIPHPKCVKLGRVDKYEALRLRILEGRSDANIKFDELRHLLEWLGFEQRIQGSHHLFRKQGVRDMINLQREGSKAKIYQVRQVRLVILRYALEGEER